MKSPHPRTTSSTTGNSDIDKKSSELELALEIQMDAINNINDGFVLWDQDDALIACNDKFKSLFFEIKNTLTPGVKHAEFVKAAYAAGLFSSQLGLQNCQIEERLTRHKYDPTPYEELLRDGRWLHIHEHKTLNHRIVGIFKDITEQKRSQIELKAIAETDSLTGLYNRTMFNEHLTRIFRWAKNENQMFGIMVFGLDFFKSINDTMGHQVGDALLRAVANRLRKCSTNSEVIARLGGDEFAVIVPEISDSSDMNTFAERIISTLGEPYDLDEMEVLITASLGISVYPHHNDCPEDLVKNADIALNNAKQNGRNQIRFFDRELDREAKKHRRIELDLQTAISENQLELHFQPQIDIFTGKIIGAEALIRWQHPELGMISPGDFIPIAESTRLILPLGNWIINKACKQAKTWQDQGLPTLNLAVNISPVQFKQHDLPRLITTALNETGLSPEWLEIEITEGVAMDENCKHQFEELKKLGIDIAIDDFGTGYSSLSQLSNFSIDRLKIDRSFVDSIDSNPEQRAIFSAIVNMAKNLNFSILAEGVETDEELKVIKALGCRQAQGYLFAPALPPKSFAEFVLAHNPTRTTDENTVLFIEQFTKTA